MNTRFGDDSPTPGVADEHGWAVLPIQDTPSRGDVVSERRERVLDDGHVVAAASQLVVHAAPAGTVGKRAVYQHDILDGWCLRVGGNRHAGDCGRGQYLSNCGHDRVLSE